MFRPLPRQKVAASATRAEGDDGRLIEVRSNSMSYAEAKEIALLRIELRSCWERADRTGAASALAQLSQRVGNDNELAAEVRRWSFKLAS
jgi:hypothetical protein